MLVCRDVGGVAAKVEAGGMAAAADQGGVSGRDSRGGVGGGVWGLFECKDCGMSVGREVGVEDQLLEFHRQGKDAFC